MLPAIEVYGDKQSAPLQPMTDLKSGRLKLRILCFNTWNTGTNVENGAYKCAEQVLHLDPDIIGFQEMHYKLEGDKILAHLLKEKWAKQFWVCRRDINWIVSRYCIESSTCVDGDGQPHNLGCRILIGQMPSSNLSSANSQWLRINVWNVHLYWETEIVPVICHGLKGECVPIRDVQQLNDLELFVPFTNHVGRLTELRNLTADAAFRKDLQSVKSQNMPMIVLGDFNTPSHLDWIESTRSSHFNFAFEFPVTKYMCDEAMMKFVDSFREAHPDPKLHPGNTWSPVCNLDPYHQKPTVLHRLDYIFYKSNCDAMRVDNSAIWVGLDPLSNRFEPNHKQNPWPSDHAAVYTDFTLFQPREGQYFIKHNDDI